MGTETNFPPSSDMVQLLPLENGVLVWCTICDEELGAAEYYSLNQVIKLWADHREAENKKACVIYGK